MSNKPLILVVDDDPDLVDMISTKLEANSYRTAKAYDGIQSCPGCAVSLSMHTGPARCLVPH